MSINTMSSYILGLIIAGGIFRIVYLLLMMMFSDASPYKVSETKHKVAMIIIAMAVAVSITGLVSYIKSYF